MTFFIILRPLVVMETFDCSCVKELMEKKKSTLTLSFYVPEP